MIMMSIRYVCFLSALLLSVTSLEAQQPGNLDLTFNPTDLGFRSGDGAENAVEEVLVQPDGKVLICGWFAIYDLAFRNFVARLNTDGTADTTFQTGSGANGTMTALARQADGKVLVGGIFYNYGVHQRRGIARLNTDGSLDLGFDPGTGLSTGTTNSPEVHSIAVQPDGKILIAGNFIEVNGTPRNNLARLNADGSVDTGFNPGTGPNGTLYNVTLLPDGKVFIGGQFGAYNGVPRGGTARLFSTGILDPLFSPGEGTSGLVEAVALQPDGSMYIGGNFDSYNDFACSNIVRLQSNGTVDPGFVPGGTFGSTVSIFGVRTLALQPDGHLLAGGTFTTFNGAPLGGIARFTPEGALDATFDQGIGTDGTVNAIALQPDAQVLVGGWFQTYKDNYAGKIFRVDPQGNMDTTFAPAQAFNGGDVVTMVQQSDEKILAIGSFKGYHGKRRIRIARLLPDGALDASFDPGTGVNSTVIPLRLQPDGRILIGGLFTSYDGITRNRIARLHENGTLDTSFDPAGGANNVVQAMAVQPDGKILIGGAFTEFNGATRDRVARLNTDGSLDPSFDPGTGADGQVRVLEMLPDGGILIAGGFTTYDGTPRNRITRLTADGSLDPAFDPGTGANGFITGLIVQPDGKLVVVGYFTSFNGTPCNHIARLEPDGSLDPDFDPGSGADDFVFCALMQTDGRIVIGGMFNNYNGTWRRGLARLNSDGSLDGGFDPGLGAMGSINTMFIQDNDRLLIGGSFHSYGGVGRNRIARLYQGISVGVEETGTARGPYLYPNPTDGSLTIHLDVTNYTNGHLRVLTVDGRVVLEQRMNGQREVLDVQRLPTGAYTVELTDAGERRLVQRFVKQ